MKALSRYFSNLALQRKLMLVSILATLAAMLVGLLTLASYDVLVARPRLAADLAGRMELLSVNLDVDLNFSDRAAASRTLSALNNSPDVEQACLFTANNKLFAYYARSGEAACRWDANFLPVGHRFHGGVLTMRAPVRFERETLGYLQVDYSLPSPLARLRQYSLVLGVVLVTLLSSSLLYALSLRRLVTQPLLALFHITDRVTREQRYDLRAPVRGQDEMGSLATAFNTMLATIAARDAALRRSQSLLNNIAEKSSAVIYVKDLDGRYLLVNQSFRQMLPPAAPEPLGRTDEQLFPPAFAAVLRRNDLAVLDSGKAAAYEEAAPAHDSGVRTMLSEKFPLIDDHGQIWALGGVSADITDRKRSELELIQYRDKLEELVQIRTSDLAESLENLQRTQDELVRSEKLAALGSLVAGVAHELNTPIGNSLLAVSTMLDQTSAFNQAAASGVKRSALESYVQDVQNGSQIVLRNLHRAVDLVASFKQVAVDRATSQCRQFYLRELVGEILMVLMPTVKNSGHPASARTFRTPY